MALREPMRATGTLDAKNISLMWDFTVTGDKNS